MKKNKKKKHVNIERDDKLVLKGVVLEALPGTLFKVKVDKTSAIVLCGLSGNLRQNHIMVIPDDNVTIEVSPYDLTRGRITWRQS